MRRSKGRRFALVSVGVTSFGVIFVAIYAILNLDSLTWWYREWRANSDVLVYGLVVDGHGDPIAGARVDAKVFSVGTFFPIGGERITETDYTFTTDSSGRFQIAGTSGQSVSIEAIAYRDYEWFTERRGHGGNRMFRFASTFGAVYVGDPDRPAVFPMLRDRKVPLVLPSLGGFTKTVGSESKLVPNAPSFPQHPTIDFGTTTQKSR